MAKIRTKARALDMLGRQQIAGIPTALSELFKNAHDAYADFVEVDYVRKQNLLILRDNGLGMTRKEFEDRWLTIGTDSKYEDEDSLAQPAIDKTKKTRQVMGEKGIGRLAIAAIGPQVLVITRAKRKNRLGNLVAAFVNWTLFSLPSLDLDDIEVPVLRKKGGQNLTKEDVKKLLEKAKNNVCSLSRKISDKKIQLICNQIDSFDFNPEQWTKNLNSLDDRLGLQEDKLGRDKRRDYLRLDETGFGTHFIISPVDEVLPEDIEPIWTRYSTDQASRLEKALLGFTNTMLEDEVPPIIARFRDHTLEGECIDRISESIFFTPEEFKYADHHFKGKFDEFGQFSGTIDIFGQKVEDVVIPWTEGKNKEILCGPFEINFAHVQGLQADTTMSPYLWKELANKTNRIGGLYIYRDGIRVLPYGDISFDFLGIETRRSKALSQYFFSHRNMLGYVNITKNKNNSLQEKAGREGFIDNKAYKQFKRILTSFLITIAEMYFIDKGEKSNLYFEQRERNKERYKALKKRDNLVSSKKNKLKSDFENFFKAYDEGYWENGVSSLRNNIQDMFSAYDDSKADFDDFVFEVQDYFKKKSHVMHNKLRISIPSGIGFGKELSNLMDRYQTCRSQIEEQLIELEVLTEKNLVEFEDRFGNRTGLRRRFSDSLEQQQEFYRKQLNDMYKKAEASIEELTKWATQEIRSSRNQVRDSMDKVTAEFSSTSFSGKTTEDLYQIKRELENTIESTTKQIVEKIEKLTAQLNTAQEGTEENAISSGELTAALESENEYLKEQHDSNAELVHLGMALGVVHHEFNSNVISIRRGLREMQPWVAKNKQLLPMYDKIRTGFEHLDGYLKTFTPLSRRLNRKRIEITGKAVSEFISDVFQERLSKEDIRIEFTTSFMTGSVVGFTSTIYPAFVNLIDNAIYWTAKSTGERVIVMDADTDGFVIRDTGPGIPTIDRENVFEFGFSRRIGGRGMGLYVTKQSLEAEGFTIILDKYSPESGAVFRIHSVEGKEH